MTSKRYVEWGECHRLDPLLPSIGAIINNWAGACLPFKSCRLGMPNEVSLAMDGLQVQHQVGHFNCSYIPSLGVEKVKHMWLKWPTV